MSGGETKIRSPHLDPKRVRRDFPVLEQQIHGKDLVYLDNAASTQAPRAVIDAVARYRTHDHANVHRGVHQLSQRATRAFESARRNVARFIGATDHREVIFTRGTTEAINLVASSFLRPRLEAGDEILLTTMEHHANIVPWQMVAEAKDAKIKVIPIDDRGDLILDDIENLLSERTRILAVTHTSNAIGTVNPVEEIIALAHARGVPVLIDAAQGVPHTKIDVGRLDCDFLAFSGHKMYGPTGIGALYGKAEHLEQMPPYQGGGDMIYEVTFEKTTFNEIPYKFEAGTPPIEGAVGLSAAIDYLDALGWDEIARVESRLLALAGEKIETVPGVRAIGTARRKAGVLSFVVDGIHPHDVGTVVDRQGVAIRVGHHCAQPVMDRYGLPATCRASFAFYNTDEDIDALVQALRAAVELFC